MKPATALWLLPGPLRRHVQDFEARIEHAAARFAAALPPAARVLDAGAGEGTYRSFFTAQRYCGIDLGVGDSTWDYSGLDARADLVSLPFRDGSFDAALNIVTLEHVPDPARVIAELARVLRPGGKLLLVVPHEWEVHQHPHDYYRYTRFGVEHLARQSGLLILTLEPAGGYFRLLARRLLNGSQFFPAPLDLLWLFLVGPAALLLPFLDRFDHKRDFTLGYIAVLQK